MPAVEKCAVSLHADQARYIDELVATGGYASASEVVRAGLRALQERDATIERWLREEVAPATTPCRPTPVGRSTPMPSARRWRRTTPARLQARRGA